MKAQFEEAKKRELTKSKATPPPKKPSAIPNQPAPAAKPTSNNCSTQKTDSKSKACFNSGMQGHLQRSCPYPRQQKTDREAHGHNKETSVACVENEATPQSPSDLVKEL